MSSLHAPPPDNGTAVGPRVGIVGLNVDRGWAAHAHVPALQTSSYFRITAVSTTKQHSADAAAHHYGIPAAFADATELARHDDVDLVVASVRTPAHAAVVEAAVSAGKHVLTEWPVGVSADETERLARAADDAGVRAYAALQRRFAPGVRHFKELVADGFVGTVRSVHARVSVPYGGAEVPAGVRESADARSGVSLLTNVAGQYLDPVLSALKPIESVTGLTARQFDEAVVTGTDDRVRVTAPDQLLISGVMQGGGVVSVHVELGKRNAAAITAEVTGTGGDLMLTGDLRVLGARGTGKTLMELEPPARIAPPPRGRLTDQAYFLSLLYDALAAQRSVDVPVPTFRDALHLERVLEIAGRETERIQPVPFAVR